MSAEKNPLHLIRTFNQLVKYLKDELDWPIETDDFEELTFDYAPEELGLDVETAVKIKEIKQLRPLTSKQPWGIFFVNFAPKQLPVVALRRILSSLVIKKRQSANKSQQAAWRLHDLLFISSYGETEHRDITFAHFAEEQGTGDLPTLRLLGWDDEDTKLKLDFVERELKAKLRWPDDESDITAWRATWSSAFKLRPREVIKTSQQLAIRLADLARSIRKRANNVLAVESDKGPLRKMHAAIKEALIHDLSTDDFVDMYAQTISYGLLTARISRPAGLVADNLADMVPVTNPFLKDMLETFLKVGGRKGKIDFDELGVNEVVQLLRDADMEAVLRDFGDRNPQEDPVIHFYELFLKEYDAKKRMQRGVFYTPRPVVSFIVRSVHETLQKEFGIEDGLADTITWGDMARRNKALTIPQGTSPNHPFVQILDPATGTGTFLVEAIDVIQKTMEGRWKKQGHMPLEFQRMWNEYVPKHLLPRLHGFELMMAPYAIAHMKIGLKLYETGYEFKSSERAQVYLTNTLEEPKDFSDRFEFDVPALAHEARAANTVKLSSVDTVVIGNPPYSKLSQNRNKWIDSLMEVFKVSIKNEEVQRQALSDDYVKFLCYASHRLSRSGVGVLGMITNNGYLDGPLFRDMRSHLVEQFNGLSILNLNGDSRKRASDQVDENVFDIQQGVAVFIGAGTASRDDQRTFYGSQTGLRNTKFAFLISQSARQACATPISPSPEQYYLLPRESSLPKEWQFATPITEIFAGGTRAGRMLPFNGAALATRHDEFAIAYTKSELVEKIRTFLDKKLSREDVEGRFRLCTSSHFDFDRARRVKEDQAVESIRPILYRPFDSCWVVYHPLLIGEPRPDVMHHLLHKNLALLTTRRVTGRPYDNVFVTDGLVEYKAATHDRNTQVFPLYLYRNEIRDGAALLWGNEGKGGRRPNLSDGLFSTLSKQYGSRSGELDPDAILSYIYAVLYSPSYRLRYAAQLGEDYARVLWPHDRELWLKLSELGGNLIALHLLKSPKLDEIANIYSGPLRPEVEKVSYARKTVWLDKEQTCGFKGVPEAVWEFHIGGYQVCEKWLKDRKGRTLSKGDIDHYNKIVVALSDTIRLMKKIDEVIDEHGGWPGAFATNLQGASKN